MNFKLKSYLPSITLALTLVMYPFTKVFSLGRYVPFYIVPASIFIVIVLWNTHKGQTFQIPKAFHYLFTFVVLSVCYNVGYTIFGDFNHLYNGSVYVFLSTFMLAMYYYISEDSQRFSRLILFATGLSTIVYVCYFIVDGFTVGHNSTLMYNINQFAFWCFLSFIVLDILSPSQYSRKWSIIIQVALFLFVLVTLSRSATAGLLLYVLMKWTSSNQRLFFLLSVSIVTSVILYSSHDWLISHIEMYKIYFNRFVRGREFRNFDKLLTLRGLNTVVENPQYLLFGAGEGNASRFGNGSGTWIHSSIVNIAFSYGVLGLCIFVAFVRKCWTQHRNVWIIVIPLIVSSLFTSMTHNLHLWIILAILLYFRENLDDGNHELVGPSIF